MAKRAKTDDSILHLVAGDSAGESLVQGLRLARRKEKVAAFTDDLSFGPIEPGDAGSRAVWADEILRIAQRESALLARAHAAFWKTVLMTPTRPMRLLLFHGFRTEVERRWRSWQPS